MRRVALYCRVSSDDQKERGTIENQVETLRTYVDMKDDMESYKEYLDDGISGTVALKERPAGANLLKDASKGLFDVVIVWKVDRFGRDTLTGLQALEELSKYNVEVISVSEPFDLNTPQGRFNFTMYLNMAELERNNILDRMFLGATVAAKKGKYLGGAVPYGYDINENGDYIINEFEASIVKNIYRLYTVEKFSYLDIATLLTAEGIPTATNSKGTKKGNITGKWSTTSINRILTNSTYYGLNEYGKKATRRKEKITRALPPIITKEEFDAAQKQKTENTNGSKRNTKNRNYLLSKMIKCEICGSTFHGYSYSSRTPVYSCCGKTQGYQHTYGTKCDNVNIPADLIEQQVWEECKYILLHYEEIANKYTSKHEYNNEETDESELEKLKTALQNKNNEKNNILSLFRKGIIDEEDLEEQLKDIKKEEKTLKGLINILSEKVKSFTENKDAAEITKNKIDYFRNRLDNLSYEEKREIVKLLIKDIKAGYEIKEGKKMSKVEITYNIVKVENCTDIRENCNLDITSKELFPWKYEAPAKETQGTLLRNLRLSNKLTREELSKLTGISVYQIRKIEKDECNNLAKYLKLYHAFFGNQIEDYILKEQ